MSFLSQKQSVVQTWLLPIATIFLFLCLKFLFVGNMGPVNEIHHLPLARHFIDPTWLARDIYYSEPPGYRLLFQLLFGPLTTSLGFLATSIIGRIVGYFAIAIGLWALARSLGMGLLAMLVSLGLFVYLRWPQGVIAGEWLIGGIEPKVFSYSAIFMALSALFANRYLWMTAWLGVAASFHALVGGWASIAIMVLLLWRRPAVLRDAKRWMAAILIYVFTGAFAVTAVLTQVLTPVDNNSQISPAYIYSFLRNAHHVNPWAWPLNQWWVLLAYVIVFVGCSGYLMVSRVGKLAAGASDIQRHRADFICFVLCTLIPFGAGILIAPLDRDGQILQYYPFRLGDLMLPLATAMLLAMVLEKLWSRHRSGAIAITLIILIAFGIEASHCYHRGVALKNFPGEEQSVNSEMMAMAQWLKHHVPEGEPVVSPPMELVALPWLSDHPAIAKFQFVPSASSADVQAWFDRITDLGGGLDLLSYVDRRTDSRRQIWTALTKAYNNLDTVQMSHLMHKYQSRYAVTNAEQVLDLPLLYENAGYRIYGIR